ncbi:hypothetical protein N781_16840 [Pontibacillus halophilus JSM 076056 = DSM 19796]|uniref:Uncharacterized protein n=1 Tax=Pontibacillus halophilus JSM 076056 = DSM 19796 TaxID=1385510 RepID=A0A0A5I9M4_9BACI|nr:hypothetical protein [Pontibacillus halophilus]KGX92507.1 hypothetical protein N781_16840 [Pontibacillus halophilus JSM 076056 = DSM 19796]
MLLKRKTGAGKWMFFLGIWVFAIGFALSDYIGINGASNVSDATSLSLILIGLILIILSNFTNRQRSSHKK